MLTLFKSEIIDANYFWLLFFWTNIVWMEVMCYDSSSTRVFIQSKKKETTNKNSAIHRNVTEDFGVYIFFFFCYLFCFIRKIHRKFRYMSEMTVRPEENVISWKLKGSSEQGSYTLTPRITFKPCNGYNLWNYERQALKARSLNPDWFWPCWYSPVLPSIQVSQASFALVKFVLAIPK